MNSLLKRLIFLFIMMEGSGILSSCTVDFVPDPVNPSLTVYSEEGKNIASALINGQPWNSFSSCGSTYWCNRITVTNQADSNRIIIAIKSGRIINSDESLSIKFTLENTGVNSLGEIMKLNNLRLQLNGQPHSGSLSTANNASHEGQLFIRRIISIDSDNYIMSGTFGFIVTEDSGQTFEVFKGRFDSYISYEVE
jgi:hypothetical protein